MEIQYIGEHLLPGQIGNGFIVLSFVSSLLATICFIAATKENTHNGWKHIARSAFITHFFAVIGIICMIFYIMLKKYFEYHYVWQHTNSAMPVHYLLAAFWEGQEGSFLLWFFWNVILGAILLRTAGIWTFPVMGVVSSAQVFLSSMLLGIYIFGFHIGSNPFLLLREHPEMMNMPFTKIADYVSKIDGRGLNPLLQNYWMLIHPPTLFLGFAATIVPFAYGIAGLWKKRYSDWQQPALPWAFFGVLVLGTGVLMGGAWAYEALSFGGFWAWDPVENASLVPWITLTAAAHVLIITKHNGKSLRTTFLLTSVTFLLVLYSSFLTRSGVLGDTSVHAFTDLGMSGQLLLFLFFFLTVSLIFLFAHWKKMSTGTSDESIWSREFWMFIGALVLLVSAFQIIFSTSIPVMNKTFGLNMAPPVEPVKHYNSWQILFASVVLIILAIGQYFSFKKTLPLQFWKKLMPSIFVSIIAAVVAALFFEMSSPPYLLLLFASLFAIIANVSYIVQRVRNGKIKNGSSIAHFGFGMVLLGALISTAKSKVISQNSSEVNVEQFGGDFKNNENILLRKGDTLAMDDYHVTYRDKRKEGVNIYFSVDYLKKNKTDDFQKLFTLEPIVQINERMGNVAEPDTRHNLTHDVYTHVTWADTKMVDENVNSEDYLTPSKHTVSPGDTMFAGNCFIVLNGFNAKLNNDSLGLGKDDISVAALLNITTLSGDSFIVNPVYSVQKNMVVPLPDSVPQLGLMFHFTHINTQNGKVDILVSEKAATRNDFIILKAIVFPFINILWAGSILMALGTGIAIYNRIMKNYRK